MTQIRGTQIKTDSIPSTKIEELDKFTIGLIKITQFESSDTFTPDSDTVYLVVEVVGGGGGGGGSGETGGTGGGGGGGGYARKRIAVASLTAPETVTIGDGGARGEAGNNSGTAGGTTSFGSHVSATGGAGGLAANASFTLASGGSGADGDLNLSGGVGWFNLTSPTSSSSMGGDSPLGWGFSGPPVHGERNANGPSGFGYGGGGGGGRNESANRAGGNGAAGICVIHEYGVTTS